MNIVITIDFEIPLYRKLSFDVKQWLNEAYQTIMNIEDREKLISHITFFIQTDHLYDVYNECENIISEMKNSRDELGVHIHELNTLNLIEIKKKLQHAVVSMNKKALKPRVFRAGAFLLPPIQRYLAEIGFIGDFSAVPNYYPLPWEYPIRKSIYHLQIKDLLSCNWWGVPYTPYQMDFENKIESGSLNIIEFPISADLNGAHIYGSLDRIHSQSQIQKIIDQYNAVGRNKEVFFILYFHPFDILRLTSKKNHFVDYTQVNKLLTIIKYLKNTDNPIFLNGFEAVNKWKLISRDHRNWIKEKTRKRDVAYNYIKYILNKDS